MTEAQVIKIINQQAALKQMKGLLTEPSTIQGLKEAGYTVDFDYLEKRLNGVELDEKGSKYNE